MASVEEQMAALQSQREDLARLRSGMDARDEMRRLKEQLLAKRCKTLPKEATAALYTHFMYFVQAVNPNPSEPMKTFMEDIAFNPSDALRDEVLQALASMFIGVAADGQYDAMGSDPKCARFMQEVEKAQVAEETRTLPELTAEINELRRQLALL